jgi:hypothetical protein
MARVSPARSFSSCLAIDVDRGADATVDELVTAVHKVLRGCDAFLHLGEGVSMGKPKHTTKTPFAPFRQTGPADFRPKRGRLP